VPKRRERVAPPPKKGGWDFRYATSNAASGWEKICAAAPGPARSAWEHITEEPLDQSARQHPLKGSLGKREVSGKSLDQWQYEVTGAGRIWYVIDEAKRVVWMTDASPGHPKATE